MILKMNSQTKPVKIRIKSGGEEHASLNSLKNNFHVLDVCDLLDNRLSRWLRQQNQHELANELDVLFPAASFEINDETIVSLLRLFFRHDIPSITFGLLDFAKYWHEHNDMVNFMNLLKVNLTVTKYYYYNNKTLLSDKEWESLFIQYKGIEKETDEILNNFKNEKAKQDDIIPKVQLENIIRQYSSALIIEIDYKNQKEVELVDFLYKCKNTKNLLANWEDKIYEHGIRKKRLMNMGVVSKGHSKEWKMIKELTDSFMTYGKVYPPKELNGLPHSIGCSLSMIDCIDKIAIDTIYSYENKSN